MALLGSSFCFGMVNPTLSIDFSLPGYFIRIPFPQHNHMFTQCYTYYFTVNITEMLTHERAIGTRPLFPPPSWPGYEASSASRSFLFGVEGGVALSHTVHPQNINSFR